MSLDFEKVTYVDGETVIGADNLNDIQDALLDLDSNKVEKEQGKGLSTEDYTSTEKTKLSGIEAGAQVNPGRATPNSDGLMSSSDKEKLDGIAQGATAVTVDATLSVAGNAADAKATGDSISAINSKIPAAASSVNKLMDAAAVNSAIATAISGVTSFSYEVVQTLPAGGAAGTIYLVAQSVGETQNIYDEYIWITDTWEKLGTKQIDLTPYRTASAQDTIDAGKQAKITASGILKGDGNGGVTAAEAGTDYGTYSKPSAGIPKTDLAYDVRTSLGKADTALQQHQSLAAYRTAAAQDEIDKAQDEEISDLKSAFDTFVNTREVLASTYQTVLPDANTAPYNSIYRIFISAMATAYTANLPADFLKNVATSDRRGILITLATKTGNPFLVQTLVSENNIYRRFKLTPTGSFSVWTGFTEKVLKEYSTYSNANNGVLSDLDNAELNTFYNFFYAPNYAPANMPADNITQYRQGIVVTYGDTKYRLQFVLISNQYYTRLYANNAWGPWLSVTDMLPKTYTVGAQDSLVSIIDTARAANRFCTIKVSGTHDILAEMQAAHPDDWSTLNDGRGLLVQDMHIIFDSTAKIVCNYTGNDTNVLENFSVFDVRYGCEVILENVNIEASRIRYCVHDDRWTSTTGYKNSYVNCKMRIDNSDNPQRSMFPHCIGGGFGSSALIVIEGCTFEGVGGSGQTDNSIVSWHNSPNADAYSKLFLHGCYFSGNGTFRAMHNGTSVTESDLQICGNSLGSPIVTGYIEGATTANMHVIAWNNIDRSAPDPLLSYRTAAAQDVIDQAQDEKIADLKSALGLTDIGAKSATITQPNLTLVQGNRISALNGQSGSSFYCSIESTPVNVSSGAYPLLFTAKANEKYTLTVKPVSGSHNGSNPLDVQVFITDGTNYLAQIPASGGTAAFTTSVDTPISVCVYVKYGVVTNNLVFEEFLIEGDARVTTDVQVAGTSIVQNGVANIPMASASTPGVVISGTITVTGTTPTITAQPGVRYICGEVATLDITLPASGVVDVTFESGSTATVLTVTPPTGVTLKWANGFDPTALEADTTYEINIMDGLGVAGQWT